MAKDVTYFRAKHLATMTAAGVIADGCVVIAGGQVCQVGRARDVRPPRVDIDVDGLLTPGLVNAHTHLELSDRTPGPPPAGGFAGWLLDMVKRGATPPADMAAMVTRAVAIGVGQCARFGITAVGDISRQCHFTRPLLRRSPLRVVSFGEVQAMSVRRHLLDERLAAATDSTDATGRLHVGLTPHAPYSVEADGYRRCLKVAIENGLPLTTHLAEAQDEAAFLAGHTGSLRSLWDAIGGLDAQVGTFEGGPVRYAQSLGLLEFPTLLAHVNYCDDDELALLATGRASVVWCPRTHAYFGHPPHPWRAMRDRGVRVCVGTDSRASSPDLNVVDDLRLVRSQSPDVPAGVLWAMATSDAADALRWGDGLGRIGPGTVADLVAWPTRTDTPLDEVLDTPGLLPTRTWVDGVIMPSDDFDS